MALVFRYLVFNICLSIKISWYFLISFLLVIKLPGRFNQISCYVATGKTIKRKKNTKDNLTFTPEDSFIPGGKEEEVYKL